MAKKGHKLFIVLLTTFIFALMPFLFWRATWFGGKLTDAELQRYLGDSNSRNVQHGLAQAAERLIKGGGHSGNASWYPRIVALAGHPRVEIRSTAAWVMGQDSGSPEFRFALLRLLHDPDPLVQRNAALSLVRFGDLSARPVILEMLRSYVIRSPHPGKVSLRLGEDETVNPGTLIARLSSDSGNDTQEVRSPLPGRIGRKLVGEGQHVSDGEPLVEIFPAPEQLWEALRALVLVGRTEDLKDVERVVDSLAETGFDARLRQQAELTARAIRSRL